METPVVVVVEAVIREALVEGMIIAMVMEVAVDRTTADPIKVMKLASGTVTAKWLSKRVPVFVLKDSALQTITPTLM